MPMIDIRIRNLMLSKITTYKIKYGHDHKKMKMMVSEEVAQKYHEIYCNGTAVDGYSLGQVCLIHSIDLISL